MARSVFFVCAACFCQSWTTTSAAGRAKKIGAPLYCGRECAGIARRKGLTIKQKKAQKAAYDAEYRARNAERRQRQKAEYHKRTYDPARAAIVRAERMPLHVEYCRRPEYRQKKSQYDLRRRASEYGPFAESYLLLLDIDRAVNERASDYDVRTINGTLNKRLQRKRDYARLVGDRA